MTARVHLTAVVDPGAQLAPDVEVGPHCVVGAGVELGAGSRLLAHAVVLGPARLGRRTLVYPFATIGAAPQDKTFAGEQTALEVGDDNVFREQVTVHRGTRKADGVTRIGSRNLFMVGAHVAHDCVVGNDAVLANLTALGGHVQVSDNVVSGGHVAVAPFVRLGRGCFLAGGARIERDVPPFVIAAGDRARVRGLNRIGLERMGVSEQSRLALKQAFGALFRRGVPLAIALREVRASGDQDELVRELCEFLAARLPPGVVRSAIRPE